MSESNHLRITNLSKTYNKQNSQMLALSGIALDIACNEFVCIVGASGCGKSTLLRIIGGLDREYSGTVTIAGKKIHGPGLDRGIVFQEHRLVPWLTVWENMDFALQTGTKEQKNKRINAHLALVGLESFAHAYPGQLSGGMSQRIAIARALVNRPGILLLDEPFGALDALTRLKLQQEVLDIWEKEKTTMIMVTHDIEEAVFMGDRVIVLSERPGRVRKDFTIALPRPRNRADMAFQQLRREIYQEFN